MRNTKTLGPLSARLITQLYDEGMPIFTIKETQRILNKGYNEATDLLAELVKRKLIKRLKSGKFLIIPQELGNTEQYFGNWFVAASEIVNSPQYYIAFYSAMHHWGMLTQPLLKTYVATPKRQITPREMMGRLKFIYIQEKHIWGITQEWMTQTQRVRISDREKTIVDALSHPQYCGGLTEIAKGIWISRERIDYEKLQRYVKKYDKKVVAKRLGYILETLGIKQPLLLKILKTYIRDRYDVFDPTLSIKKVNKNRWRLIDNVGQNAILSVIGY